MPPGKMSAGNQQHVDAVWLQVGRKLAGCLLLSGGSRQEIGKRKEGAQEACKIEGSRPDSSFDLGVGGYMGGVQN